MVLSIIRIKKIGKATFLREPSSKIFLKIGDARFAVPVLKVLNAWAKNRLQNYVSFVFKILEYFKGGWKQFGSSYFVTIPKGEYEKKHRV